MMVCFSKENSAPLLFHETQNSFKKMSYANPAWPPFKLPIGMRGWGSQAPVNSHLQK